jgi:hypothetical protein
MDDHISVLRAYSHINGQRGEGEIERERMKERDRQIQTETSAMLMYSFIRSHRCTQKEIRTRMDVSIYAYIMYNVHVPRRRYVLKISRNALNRKLSVYAAPKCSTRSRHHKQKIRS